MQAEIMQPVAHGKYDEEATAIFLQVKENSIFKVIEDDSILHHVGDVQGLSVLDVGCGNGGYCRRLKQKGASRVVGVDLSDSMIRICQQEEQCRPLGVEYHVADCYTMGKLGEFDLVLSNYVLVYAPSARELETFAENVYLNLKPGGRFMGANMTPLEEMPFDKPVNYGFHCTKLEDLPRGAKFHVCMKSKDAKWQDFIVLLYSFEEGVYREVFEGVGFKSFSYYPPLVSEKVRKAFPEGFWDEYLERHPLSIFVANK